MISRKDKDKDIKAKKFEEGEERAEKGPERTNEAEQAKREEVKDVIIIDKLEYEKLKEAAQLSGEFKDKYLRAYAELDNARKRFIKEKEEYAKFANEELLSEILHIVDNFDRALEHMNSTQNVESILEGVKMIQKQFHLLLELNGVQRIETLGKKFDPAFHEAVEHVEVEEEEEGMVIEEVQAGYLLNGRLLRPAAVKVGRKIK